MVPEFAVVGHPNEGKSSVLSTLAEDDRVRVSPFPGETVVCQRFPVVIDGREVICFTDTPGFQNPRRVLQILQGYGSEQEPIARFIREQASDSSLHDDLELLGPIASGAGIIYVVDGSRPLRNVDRAEMEILRLTGRPRMAVINCKEDGSRYLDEWREAFRRSFNSVRVFSAHQATYRERIELLQALQHIEQDWLAPLEQVINAFQLDWRNRNQQVVDVILAMLTHCLRYSLSAPPGEKKSDREIEAELLAAYTTHVSKREQQAHEQIRRLYKHNIFQLRLPPHSILEQELFHEKTWQFLGLDRKQLILAGCLSGAAVGAGLDLAHAGLSLGLFSALGGLAGLMATTMDGRKILNKGRIFGMGLTSEAIRVGPARNVQFLFVLLDRALLYYTHVINWAHGRREQPVVASDTGSGRGYIRLWSSARHETARRYFKEILQDGQAGQESEQAMRLILAEELDKISNSGRPGAILANGQED